MSMVSNNKKQEDQPKLIDREQKIRTSYEQKSGEQTRTGWEAKQVFKVPGHQPRTTLSGIELAHSRGSLH